MSAMKLSVLLTGLLIAPFASGCSTLANSAFDQSNVLMAAEPLSVQAEDFSTLQDKPLPTRLAYLGSVVYDSEQKCSAYLSRLVSAQSSVNTTGDILSGTLSGLGAVFTPASTVRALSAAATIVTGAKSAIASDFFAKASIANFATALQQTYGKQIQQYTDALPTLTDSPTPLIVSNEVSKIQSYHALCAIAPAEASIAATIQPPVQSVQQPDNQQSSHAALPPNLQGNAPQTRAARGGDRLY